MLDELFIRGGPVLFILFFISFFNFFIFVNKYIFIYFDKSDWFKINLIILFRITRQKFLVLNKFKKLIYLN